MREEVLFRVESARKHKNEAKEIILIHEVLIKNVFMAQSEREWPFDSTLYLIKVIIVFKHIESSHIHKVRLWSNMHCS